MDREPLFVLLGMEPDEWEHVMEEGRKTPCWQGMPVSSEPNYHAHPALGITGHSHSRYEDARRPHIHRPVVAWDWTPIYTDEQI